MNLIAAKTKSSNTVATEKKLNWGEALDKEVALDLQQKKQVDILIDEHRKETQEIMRSVQPRLDELRLKTRQKIRLLLNTGQQQKFDDWNQRKDAERLKNQSAPVSSGK